MTLTPEQVAAQMEALGFRFNGHNWEKPNVKSASGLKCIISLPPLHAAYLCQTIQDKVEAALSTATALQPFEIQNYKRLMALEARGIEEYRDMRAEKALTPEAVVSFINQLSPWNLKTTGLDVLKAYLDQAVQEARFHELVSVVEIGDRLMSIASDPNKPIHINKRIAQLKNGGADA